MKNRYYIIIGAVICTLFMVQTIRAAAMPSDPIMSFMPDNTNIRVEVEQKSVTVYGAQNQTLEVISVTGKHILRVKIDNNAQRIELNVPKGCYILKVGSVVRKVSIH